MELNHLKYFYEVASIGSYTKASRVMRVSQPAISKMVMRLEEEVGATLLDRSRRGGVHLTSIGKRVFEICDNIFSQVKTLSDVIDQEHDECRGDLGLGASDNLCNYILPEFAQLFLKQHSLVKLKLFSGTSESIQAELIKGNSELGLFYARSPKGSGLESKDIGFVDFNIVYSPLLAPAGLSYQELVNTNHLKAFYYIGSRATDYFKIYPALRMLHSIGIRPEHILETNHQETQKRLALHGYGYTVVPHFMARTEIENGLLSAVKLPKSIGAHIYLAKRKNRTLSKPALEFESFVSANLAKFLAKARSTTSSRGPV